jgi:hypothetical protein
MRLGELAPPPKAPSNPTKSVGNKIYLFLMRTIITMVGIILAKSLFLCWYNDTYDWLELWNNIYSLYSGLIAIGYLVGLLINKLLDFTPLNIKL